MNLSEFSARISVKEKPVIVDFWAAWCMPCKITKPILEKLAQEYSNDVDFLAIDADLSSEILKKYHILGLPTVLVFRGGEVIARVTGTKNEAAYRAMFATSADGSDVKIPISNFDCMLRLGAGFLLGIVGVSTDNWLVLGIAGIIAFFGIYDRCPVWGAVTGMLRAGK